MKLLNLPIDCTMALKQEGRAQKFTCGHLHSHVYVCVYMQEARGGACRNVLGFKKSYIKNNEAWDKNCKVFNASSDYF